MSEVWRRAIEAVPKMILLKLADHSNDQGENICPSVGSVARHVGCSERTVQRRLGQYESIQVLEDVGPVTYGRGRVRGWRINLPMLRRCFPTVDEQPSPAPFNDLVEHILEATKGDSVSPFDDAERVTADAERVTAATVKGDIALSPESSRTIIEPSRARGGDPDGPPRERSDEDPPTPENAHWRAAEERLRKRFGEASWRCWLAPLIAAKDDGPGSRMVLWAPSPFVRDRVARDFADKLAQLLDRRVEVVFVAPAQRHQARLQLEAQR